MKDPEVHAGPVKSNCQRPQGISGPQRDQGQARQRGARGPLDTWAGPDFRMEIEIQIFKSNWTPNSLSR